MDSPQGSVTDELREQLSRRGWAVTATDRSITACKHEWPAQLKVVVDPGGANRPSMLGLLVDFRSMPLHGERFRDIFNSEREDIMRGLGEFRARQMREDSGWTDGVSDRAFLRGVDGGVCPTAEVVLFDRCPEETGEAILERFNQESSRLVETGGEIASLLQRAYNRAVLRNDAPVSNLPEVIASANAPTSPVIVGDSSYPWRR
jgi:hypothetical protein